MLWSDRRGVGTWEYAVLAALLGLVLVTVLQTPVHELSEIIGNWMGSTGSAGGGGGGGGGATGP
jgi:Flp pilus assembly pilin Flp